MNETSAPATKPLASGIACHIEGSGPALVLLHGGGGSWTHWVRNIPALRSHHTVYALDMPGFGDSVAVSPDIATEDYVGLVCQALEDIAQREAIDLCGFSFGAVNATLVAARMPKLIRKLALVAPGGFGRVSPPGTSPRKIEESASEAEKREATRHNLLLMMLAHPEPVDDAAIEMQRRNAAPARFTTRRFTGSTLTRDNLWRVRTRTLAIFGALDNLSHPSVYARINPCCSVKPDIRLEVIPNAGHWVQYEAADAVNRLLIDFFR